MSENRKYVVPEGMLTAADQEIRVCSSIPSTISDRQMAIIQKITIEAALRWLSKNPIVPTPEQNKAMSELARSVSIQYGTNAITDASTATIIVEWQRRMFAAPEPEIPPQIEDLMLDPKRYSVGLEKFNAAVLEAFNRGRRVREK